MGDNAVSSREGCDSPVDMTACPLGGQVLRRAARVARAHASVELQRLFQHQAALPALQISMLASGVCGLDQCSCHSTHSRLRVVLLQVLIRRLKKDVLTQLPPKIRQRVPLNVGTADLRKAQKTMKQLDERRNMGEILASDDPDEALAARNEDRNEFMEAYREIGECTGLLVVSAASSYGTGRS